MNFSIIAAIIIFVILFSIGVYANSHSYFCSLISCNNDFECIDQCDESHWYYGNGICSQDCCPPPSPMHCRYDSRVCADSDTSDGFPNINCQIRTCSAECDQDSDCICSKDECIENDYYDYPDNGTCDESCKCRCEPIIAINDSRCIKSLIEVNKTTEPNELFCNGTIISLMIRGVGKNLQIVDFLPGYVILDSELPVECEYDNETRKITCSLDNITAGEEKLFSFNVNVTQLGHALTNIYPDSGVSYINNLGNNTFVSFPETYVNVLGSEGSKEICDDGIDNNCNGLIDSNDSECYQCEDGDNDSFYNYSIICPIGNDCNDSNPSINPNATETCSDGIDNNCDGKIDCNDFTCNSNPICVTNGGFIGGGPIIGGSAPITTYCSDKACNGKENCTSCPKDCMKTGEICCNGIAYNGNCCVDVDCGRGFECSIAKKCNPLNIVEEVVQAEPKICLEDWICTSWSECKNDMQIRKCVDKNACDSNKSKPEENQACKTESIGFMTGLLTLLGSPSGFTPLAVLITFIFLLFWKRRKK